MISWTIMTEHDCGNKPFCLVTVDDLGGTLLDPDSRTVSGSEMGLETRERSVQPKTYVISSSDTASSSERRWIFWPQKLQASPTVARQF